VLNEIVLREVLLTGRHRPTGATVHVVGGSELPTPAMLRISRYDDQAGFYLLYLDHEGVEMTDTWHETVEAAMAQATFEFEVEPLEWHEP